MTDGDRDETAMALFRSARRREPLVGMGALSQTKVNICWLREPSVGMGGPSVRLRSEKAFFRHGRASTV